MSKPTYYITTPIYYSSGKLHLGHCYTTVICDALARFKRMDGYDVFYLTGTDEHGMKVEEIAKSLNKTPKQYVDELFSDIVELWGKLGISYDKIIRTTDDYHEKTVQKIYKILLDKGAIYKSRYKGLYCTPCESFWTESQLVNGCCPDCGRPVHEEEEESYFFRLSQYGDKLLELYKNNPDFISPKSRMNEMINNFIKPGLKDLCISRTNCKWGVPLDFDPKHVAYVWIDALSNYITALGYLQDDDKNFKKFWPADLHMVGKEITRFHTIIWPAILMALDLPMPKQVYGHGWLNFYGDKMSKSKGNVAYPIPLMDRYGVDAVRYYLLREIPFGNDGSYTDESFLNRFNTDLCNSLGNLVSRTTAMIAQYFGGKLPKATGCDQLDQSVIDTINGALSNVKAHIEQLNVPDALADIWQVIHRANKYIDETAPWALAKDESQKERLQTVLYNLYESIRVSATLLAPFLPDTAQSIYDKLSLGKLPKDFKKAKYGLGKVGTTIEKGDHLFARLDINKEMQQLKQINEQYAKASTTASTAQKPADDSSKVQNKAEITIDDFAKVQLVTAKVLSCEKAPKSDKLLVLQLQVGNEQRQVVSGIAQHYSPEDLVGKTVVLCANLKPVKLRGIESQGMILCAADDNSVVFVTPEKEIGDGKEVR